MAPFDFLEGRPYLLFDCCCDFVAGAAAGAAAAGAAAAGAAAAAASFSAKFKKCEAF